MVNVEVVTIPVEREMKDVSEKIKLMVEDRNNAISKKLGFELLDVEVKLYFNKDKVVSLVGSADERLGVFSGYLDYTNGIILAHPDSVEPIFGDALYKEFGIMIDYCLYKYYLCKNFFPEEKDYRLYYKYLTDVLARVLTPYFNKSSIEFDIKMFNEFKKYTKVQELFMGLYIVSEKSGLDMILDNLKVFYEDCNIKKSLMKIYKKELKEFVKLSQEEMIKTERALKKVR